jgi:type IX secretion system PorP/SprF family membrane protein
MVINKNIFFSSLVLLILNTTPTFSQDIHFSQFYQSPVLLNPAAAGASNSDFRLAINYKNQWKSVISPFKTLAIAFDSRIYVNKKHRGNFLGYGITLFNDKAGISKLTTNQGNLDLAYHLQFSRSSSFSAGIKGGIFQKSINPLDLKWDAQYDGKNYDASLSTKENMPYQNFTQIDLATGLMYKFVDRESGFKLEVGGSLSHLTKPKISFYNKDNKINYKYIGHLNAQFKLSETIYLLPAAMYALQGKQSELIAGCNFKIILGEQTRDKVILNTFNLSSSAIQFGAYYRFKDAIVFNAMLDFGSNMSFGMSYDVNVSKLILASKHLGGMEFSFLLRGINNGKTKGSKNDR